jgi:hypothetical protein
MRQLLYVLSISFLLIAINHLVLAVEEDSVIPQPTVIVTIRTTDKHYEMAVMGGLDFISASSGLGFI